MRTLSKGEFIAFVAVLTLSLLYFIASSWQLDVLIWNYDIRDFEVATGQEFWIPLPGYTLRILVGDAVVFCQYNQFIAFLLFGFTMLIIGYYMGKK